MPNREAEGLYAEFHLHPVLQAEQSHKEGREIYKDEIYVKIQIKGQKNQVRDRKMKPEDKADYPNAWERWCQRNEEIKDGTPITALPGVGPSMELELRGLGIRTVEDMAKLTDASATNMRGGYMFRERAKAYLAACAVKPAEPLPPTDRAEPPEAPVDVEALQRDANVIAKPGAKRGRKAA